MQVKLDRENGLKKAALKRARDLSATVEKESEFKKARAASNVMLNLYKGAKADAKALGNELEDKSAVLKEMTHPVIRAIMDAAEAFVVDELAPLDVTRSKPAPTQQPIKVRVFAGLRAAGFDVAGLEAAYAAWWEGAGDAKGLSDGIAEAWEEATKK